MFYFVITRRQFLPEFTPHITSRPWHSHPRSRVPPLFVSSSRALTSFPDPLSPCLPKAPQSLPCNEDILPVGRLMAYRERYLTNPKPPDSSGNFTQNLSGFFSLEGESIQCVNESGKSNSKRQWDLRWGANCTKVMPDWSRDPWGRKKKKVSSFHHNRGHCCYLCC